MSAAFAPASIPAAPSQQRGFVRALACLHGTPLADGCLACERELKALTRKHARAAK